MNVAAGWSGDLQEPNGLNCPRRCESIEAGHHRCHGEETWVRDHETEIGVGSLCKKGSSLPEDEPRDQIWLVYSCRLVDPFWIRTDSSLDGVGVRVVRGIADHLPHHGFLL